MRTLRFIGAGLMLAGFCVALSDEVAQAFIGVCMMFAGHFLIGENGGYKYSKKGGEA